MEEGGTKDVCHQMTPTCYDQPGILFAKPIKWEQVADLFPDVMSRSSRQTDTAVYWIILLVRREWDVITVFIFYITALFAH